MEHFSCCKLEIFIPSATFPLCVRRCGQWMQGTLETMTAACPHSRVTSCWRPLAAPPLPGRDRPAVHPGGDQGGGDMPDGPAGGDSPGRQGGAPL